MLKAIVFISFLLFPFVTKAEIIITEVMYDLEGTDSGFEWVEIFNTSTTTVNIDGSYKFNDGSNHNLNLAQGTSTLPGNSYALIVDKIDNWDIDGNVFDSVISISNSNPEVSILKDDEIIDLVTIDNALANGNGYSYELIEGVWQESYAKGGTPLESPGEKPVEEEEIYTDYTDLIVINELLPNPKGSDTTGEWIELFNKFNEPVDLTGWILSDGSSRKYTLETSVKPLEYLVLERGVTNISLNNTSDSLELRDSEGEVVDLMEYNEVKEGYSWARLEEDWLPSSNPTKGSPNSFPANQPPVIEVNISNVEVQINDSIVFDGSNSYDPEGSKLEFEWDFNDGDTSDRKEVSHKFKEPGIYIVNLKVFDEEGNYSSDNFNITVIEDDTLVDEEIEDIQEEDKVAEEFFLVEGIIISEFMPNPKGTDQNEWIEIYNQTEEDVNISGWWLDDAEGGSKKFVFPDGSLIKANSFQVWSRRATGLALNNTTDEVRLFWPTGELLDSVSYESVKEDRSYSLDRINLEWFWGESTAGKENIIIRGEEVVRQNNYIPQILEGLVLVPPQVWYKQKIYLLNIEDPENEVIEVYNYKGDFPPLEQGQLVQVLDYEVSELKTGLRYKISSSEQINILDNSEINWPDVYDVSELSDDFLNKYIAVQGKVEKVNKNSFRVTDELDSLTVYLGSDWQWSNTTLEKDLGVIVKGVLQKSGETYKLRPISEEDFKIETKVVNQTIKEEQKVEEISLGQESNNKALYIISPAALAAVGYAGYKLAMFKLG